jgi:hypothetical protein
MNDIHDPFVTNEFINMLSKYVEIKRIKGIPTINGRTYFWANKKFEDVKKQYVIGGNKTSPKSYFVKYPCNYEETYLNYARDFKNHLKKSKGKLALEIKNNSNNIWYSFLIDYNFTYILNSFNHQIPGELIIFENQKIFANFTTGINPNSILLLNRNLKNDE